MAASSSSYPRDMVGYGEHPPHPQWPNDARIAVSFVLNYEEGGESSVLHGDKQSEHLLSEIVGATPKVGVRCMNMESLYEYGSRAGFWRLLRLFAEKKATLTVYAVAMALERNEEAARAMVRAGWEVASHGYRWIDYQYMNEDEEREHIRKCVEIQQRLIGERPVGLYQGKPSPQSRRLTAEEGGFMYSNDYYGDDLPFYEYHHHHHHHHHDNKEEERKPLLILPYTLDANDMRFCTPQGFHTSEQFFVYLRDTFDTLYTEGEQGAPKMMTIGLHCRIVGHPGRVQGLRRFIEYIQSKPQVWICQRREIAEHWLKTHPPTK